MTMRSATKTLWIKRGEAVGSALGSLIALLEPVKRKIWRFIRFFDVLFIMIAIFGTIGLLCYGGHYAFTWDERAATIEELQEYAKNDSCIRYNLKLHLKDRASPYTVKNLRTLRDECYDLNTLERQKSFK